VVLVMTSNVGAEELSRRRAGFAWATGRRRRPGLRAHLPPEFRNRLDARISFAPLSLPVMERIVDRMVGEVRERLAARRCASPSRDAGARAGWPSAGWTR
jgi:ATP-dependent Clp protease ATP-binding subunit ClpA